MPCKDRQPKRTAGANAGGIVAQSSGGGGGAALAGGTVMLQNGGTGNGGPWNAEFRKGDNLYSSSILALEGVPPARHPVLHGRLRPLGPGKDSTAGHWELMGVITPRQLPTYPHGFPPEVTALVTAVSGRQVVCNLPYNGIGAIEDFGAEQLSSEALIVYTSQDSVLQIAAHVDVVAPQELYQICRAVRQALPVTHAVGRVIARPFRGSPADGFERTDGRRDFSIEPPGPSYLQALQARGIPVHAVGKAGQLFRGIGVDVQHEGATNRTALSRTRELIDSLHSGLVFTNLIETDQLYGHRHDVGGVPGVRGRVRDASRVHSSHG